MSTPTVTITAEAITTRMAPTVVSVWATDSTLGAGTWDEAIVEWRCDTAEALPCTDPRDGTTQRSMNGDQIGMSAAFLFEDAGDHEILCRITNANGERATGHLIVTVVADTRTTEGTNLIYCDAQAFTEGVGTIASPFKTIDAAIAAMPATNGTLRLKAGTSPAKYTLGATYSLGDGIIIESYGTGSAPIITGTTRLLRFKGEGCIIRDIIFRPDTAPSYVEGISSHQVAKSCAVIDCEFEGDSTANMFSRWISFDLGGEGLEGGGYVHVINCVGAGTDGQSTAQNLVWWECKGGSCWGTTFAGSTAEQNMRIAGNSATANPGVTHATICYSEGAHNTASGKSAWRFQSIRYTSVYGCRSPDLTEIGFDDLRNVYARVDSCVLHGDPTSEVTLLRIGTNVNYVTVVNCVLAVETATQYGVALQITANKVGHVGTQTRSQFICCSFTNARTGGQYGSVVKLGDIKTLFQAINFIGCYFGHSDKDVPVVVQNEAVGITSFTDCCWRDHGAGNYIEYDGIDQDWAWLTGHVWTTGLTQEAVPPAQFTDGDWSLDTATYTTAGTTVDPIPDQAYLDINRLVRSAAPGPVGPGDEDGVSDDEITYDGGGPTVVSHRSRRRSHTQTTLPPYTLD